MRIVYSCIWMRCSSEWLRLTLVALLAGQIVSNWWKSTPHIPKIMKNRTRRLQNHEKRGPGGHLEAICSRSGPRDGNVGLDRCQQSHFGSHFGGHFRLKIDVVRHLFLHQIWEGFFMMLMDCGAHFHDFWAPKSDSHPKKRKYEKPMFSLRKTYVFEGSGLSFLV